MINVAFVPEKILFSSDIPDVNIFTDCKFVNVSLCINSINVLNEKFYAYNGRICVEGLANIVTDFLSVFISDSYNYVDIEVTGKSEYDGAEESKSISFGTIYCAHSIGTSDAYDFLSENFLTLSQFRRIPSDGFLSLKWIAFDGQSARIDLKVAYDDGNGNAGSLKYAFSGNGLKQHGDELRHVLFYVRDITQHICIKTGIENVVVQQFTVTCGNRSMTVFVDPTLVGIRPFYFSNCFNVEEAIALPNVTTEKLKKEQGVAVFKNSSLPYDVVHSVNYESTFPALTSHDCVMIKQLLSANYIRIPWEDGAALWDSDFEALTRVFITEFNADFSESDDAPNSASITWRFVDNRIQLGYSSSRNIFNVSFNPIFN